MARLTALRALADREGILPEYRDIRGALRPTPDDTRVALLAAMGIDASTEDAAARALTEADRRAAQRPIDPVAVHLKGRPSGRHLRVRVPEGLRGGRAGYRIELGEERGAVHRQAGELRLPAAHGTVRLPLPTLELEPGYHRLRLALDCAAGPLEAEQSYVVCPASCVTVGELLGERRGFGVWAHLYSVRGAGDWGVGDLTDLHELVDWAGELGAAFVGINPLHALRNAGSDISPYSPVSRLYRNVVYLDIKAVPELAECEEARRRIASSEHGAALKRLRAARHVDYEGVMALKRPVLQALHGAFARRHRDKDSARGRAYARFLERHSRDLTDFATFLALEDHFRERGLWDWRSWPREFRDPNSRAVADFRQAREERVDLHRYLQFELDRQLARAATAAELPIGLYGDLAVGTAPNGYDAWAFPGLFLDGAHIGAPPDDYSVSGQDWGLPPVDPRRLREDGYRYWITLLRNALEHMGALRLDHVMGLVRQYWVPAGRPATEGAYVRYPAGDLLGILALESRRHGALIVGEDLGTVPPALPSLLARWGILSSRVLYFERDRQGGFRRSRSYSKRALVTADTHDHPPLAGFWQGRDIELRREVGDLATPAETSAAREERERDRRALLKRLRAEGCLEAATPEEAGPELCAAVHAFLARTPAPLVGVWLDDLAGETEPVNLPGTGLDRYPSWSRRLGQDLEALEDDPTVERGLSGLVERRLRQQR